MSAELLVIHTGGTIGMMPGPAGLEPVQGFERMVRERLGARLGALPTFDFIELEPLIDSAELSPGHWAQLVALIEQHLVQYRGIVILHGTDTLAYTAAALSFMLAGLDRPVILTGSQIPLHNSRNDAEGHLLGALELAARPEIHEVAIYFNGRLLRGNRATKMDAGAMAAFDSPNFPELATLGIDLALNEQLLLPAGTPKFSVATCDADSVAVLRLFPGLSAGQLQAMLGQAHCRALILQCYGVGNAPVSQPGWLETLEAAVAAGKVVVNISQCYRGAVVPSTYATGSALERVGVIAGNDMTLEAAFGKLHWLLAAGHSAAEIAGLMQRSICGEMG
ncbi:asparaginase [Marinobacterium litorale]|uniref:asparaginase n=1 Tax=Marinobacterium litorale TaxID=404770 RepID=UPI0004263001|nr:asparaginase [Marinobacterium litorale]